MAPLRESLLCDSTYLLDSARLDDTTGALAVFFLCVCVCVRVCAGVSVCVCVSCSSFFVWVFGVWWLGFRGVAFSIRKICKLRVLQLGRMGCRSVRIFGSEGLFGLRVSLDGAFSRGPAFVAKRLFS